jgi:hypothetical protein
VSAHATIDVAAEERIVWAVIADIAAWPTWDPSMRHATFDADLESGAAFRYVSALGSIKCRLIRVEAPRELAWRGRLLATTMQQTFRIEPTQSGCHVSVDATLSGVLARILRRRLQARVQAELDSVVRLLRLEAEVRSSAEREEAARREATAMGEHRDG